LERKQITNNKNEKMKNENWTTANMPDLSGKVIIVTGGNSGLGYESVKVFAQKGAEVILACRSVEKGEAAKTEIMKNNPAGKIEVMNLDLMDLSSVKNFAVRFKENHSRLNVLLNNAGIMIPPYGLTKDGFESQIGTNHLGHFALTGQLIDLIVKTPKSRVVSTSSLAHKNGKMDFDNFMFDNGNGYTPMKAYGRSKLANLLFIYELQRLFAAKGIDSVAVVAHPGVSQTNLMRFVEGKFYYHLLKPLSSLILQSAAMGALPQLRAAVDPNVQGGDYYGPDGFNEMKGSPVKVKSIPASYNTEDAKQLWKLSEKLTGITYNF